ncbi:MAG: calcium/sodium antiporter [Flavobacteriales bacterium]
MDILILILGLVILLISGELLVRGAVAVAIKMNISSLVIGLTVVSLGTSAPELLVSLKSAIKGHPDISLGNVVGSNISNLGLVLGFTVLIFPIIVENDSIKIDWPVMMLASLLCYYLALDNELIFWEGVLFLLIIVSYITFSIMRSRKKRNASGIEEYRKEQQRPLLIALIFVAFGCAGLIYGSDFLLDGAVGIAKKLGVSEKVIAVSLVAFGTSVPELFTSGIAAFKKETDISVGNLIGSNIFNILVILGITSLFHDLQVSEEILQKDIFWMLGISFLIFTFMLHKNKLHRWKGGVLLIYYILYIVFSFA